MNDPPPVVRFLQAVQRANSWEVERPGVRVAGAAGVGEVGTCRHATTGGVERTLIEELAGRASTLDLDGSGAATVIEEVQATGGVGLVRRLDVADGDAMRDPIADAVSTFGRLDILCNNAAIFEPAILSTDLDIETTPVETWDRTMNVNLRGPMLAAKHAIPAMLGTTGRGNIINISSTSGFHGDVIFVAYSASKATLQALTRSIATSHGRKGIGRNCVATGLILTDVAKGNLSPDLLEVYRQNRLVNEVGTPEEVATLVEYLASDASRCIDGQTIVMDGGATAHQPWHAQAHVLYPELFR